MNGEQHRAATAHLTHANARAWPVVAAVVFLPPVMGGGGHEPAVTITVLAVPPLRRCRNRSGRDRSVVGTVVQTNRIEQSHAMKGKAQAQCRNSESEGSNHSHHQIGLRKAKLGECRLLTNNGRNNRSGWQRACGRQPGARGRSVFRRDLAPPSVAHPGYRGLGREVEKLDPQTRRKAKPASRDDFHIW